LKLQTAGAEALVICTNTIHKVADQIQSKIKIPLLNIIDAIGERILSAKIQKVGLLGTRFTMEDGFYVNRLKNQFKIETIIPSPSERDFIHSTIFNELTQGVVNPESHARMIKIVQTLIDAGAHGIILGCTELPMILGEKDVNVPLFDSLQIHIEKVVSWALGLAS
jgi:aspartate racemase